MEKRNFVLKILAIICFTALLITFALHEYQYSFDPYIWLESGKESVESRNLWNVRKELYRRWMLIFFIGSIIFGFSPILNWFTNCRKINLK